PPLPGLPAKAADAFQASFEADPTFPLAAPAFAAAKLAERDAAAAEAALAKAPAAATKDERYERAAIAAAAEWLRGDVAKARSTRRAPSTCVATTPRSSRRWGCRRSGSAPYADVSNC